MWMNFEKNIFWGIYFYAKNRFSEILCYKHLWQPTFSTLFLKSTCHQLSENVCLKCGAIHAQKNVCHRIVSKKTLCHIERNVSEARNFASLQKKCEIWSHDIGRKCLAEKSHFWCLCRCYKSQTERLTFWDNLTSVVITVLPNQFCQTSNFG